MRLKEREAKEEEERNRRMNMEEETKYDFSSYLLDKSKGFGRSNTVKGQSGRTGHGGKSKGGYAGLGGGLGSGNVKSAAVAAGLMGGGGKTAGHVLG